MKKGIEEALRLREVYRVDPFKTGYGHAKQSATINLNAVRLCFQEFLEGQQRGFDDLLARCSGGRWQGDYSAVREGCQGGHLRTVLQGAARSDRLKRCRRIPAHQRAQICGSLFPDPVFPL
ncbi:uncharacterized protein LOC129750827 [Uranotaenia lowii]|uniref:uncharacterized protein LOC129750827 n=1 Tax=Uranotaenia lowii TaxID=190385 RepID=UPI00247A7934|nr:uncharacterized protein LOC129750827 [Uranotaenia lowii]